MNGAYTTPKIRELSLKGFPASRWNSKMVAFLKDSIHATLVGLPPSARGRRRIRTSSGGGIPAKHPTHRVPGNINHPFSHSTPKPTSQLGILYSCSCSPCRRISLREPLQSPAPSAGMSSPPVRYCRSATCLRSMCAPCILQSDRSRAPCTDAWVSSRTSPRLIHSPRLRYFFIALS
jgi:hypothetical protein